MLARLFKPRPSVEQARLMYAALARQARQPQFYADLGAPDTPEGRFELYTLHLALLLRRLRGQGEGAAEASQALFDRFVTSLDDSLREMGVGDLSVGKKMRKLGEALYGRLKAYESALGDDGDDPLKALIGRTLYAGAGGAAVEPVADYMRRAESLLGQAQLNALMTGDVPWPTPNP